MTEHDESRIRVNAHSSQETGRVSEVIAMRPGKIVLIVVGAVLALVGLGFVAGGGTLVWANATQRDASGYYNTPTDPLSTTTYALTGSVDFGSNASQADWVPAHPAGTVRVRATSTAGKPVFIGIASQSAVDSWLRGVAHEHVTSIEFGPFSTETHQVAGIRPATAPSREGFWATSTSGSGTQTLTWPTQRGSWSVVVMNASATRGVAVDVSVGMNTGLLLPIGIGLGLFGLLILGGAAVMLYFGLRRPLATQVPSPYAVPAPAPGVSVAPGSYPVRLDGRLDPTTSRWLWLVKWVLVIPHVVVLAVLWLAVFLLTVVAGFAILLTGRYPRPIFDFNSGVMRWTWRVSFYAIGAFGTDRYPPFSLAPDPTFPADLTIDYPDHLSRGLVLVKWWLLALPQYVIVAFFAGGWGFGLHGSSRGAAGVGLIGVLALVAAVVLAVRGRYPESIFDFVMGMNRWCYRVLGYAALMRDEYPPFRLDNGGTDPGHQWVPPPPKAPDLGGELVGAAH
jgi:hypothetical protein